MENCDYTKVETNISDGSDFDEEKSVKSSWKPLLRQVFICFGLWTLYFLNGAIVGAPTVIIPQLRREANSTAAISDEKASWLMSVFAIASLPWILILPVLMHSLGRKISIVVIYLQTFIGCIVFYFSNTTTQLLISLIILGPLLAGTVTVTPILVSEYTSPKYRGMFLAIKSASIYWGVWVSNAIGTYFHWKVIGIMSLVMTAYSVTVLFWPESPHWLATKGRFKECADAHRWLKGIDRNSEEELEKLIDSQKEFFASRQGRKSVLSWANVVNTLKALSSKKIYKPLLICILLFLHYFASGKIVCSIYVLEIIKKLSNNESTAYKTMLISDGVTVLGMYIGCVLSKYLKRRTLMVVSSIITIVFLFIITLYMYLIKCSVLKENSYISISLLTMYSMGMSCGPMILSTSLYAELMPLRFKSTITFIVAFISQILFFTTIKVAPSMFSSLGLHGSFLFYAVGFTFCSLFLYKYLPETKDKTLQEIEEYFK